MEPPPRCCAPAGTVGCGRRVQPRWPHAGATTALARARALAAAAPVHRRCWELPVPAARARARSCGCHSPGQLLPVAAQAIRVPSTLARQPCQPVLCISRSHACTCIAYCAFMACAPTPALWVQASAAGRRHAAPLPPHMAQAPAGGPVTRACAQACARAHACTRACAFTRAGAPATRRGRRASCAAARPPGQQQRPRVQ